MPVNPSIFGLQGFAFPAGGVACDYPAESDVRAGTAYGSGVYTGTLAVTPTVTSPEGPHSPADIIRHLLADLGLVSLPESGGIWPAWVASEQGLPDNAVTVYDTQGRDHGRSGDGERLEHGGIQIRIRAATHTVGYAKAWQIQEAVDTGVDSTGVEIAGSNYCVSSINRVSTILALGKEPGSKRSVFIINALAYILRL